MPSKEVLAAFEKATKPKAVFVRWRDSAHYRGWQNATGVSPMHCASIGWLIEETKGHIAIALSRSEDEDGLPWGEVEVIPRECIISTKVVKL